MGRNKIFRKMFLMTLGLAFAILFVQFIFQYFWLDDFYLYSKEVKIEKQLEIVENTILSENDSNLINRNIKNQMDKENSVISIFTRYGKPYYGVNYYASPYYLTLLSEDKNVYQVNLDAFYGEKDLLSQLKVGQKISVKGYIAAEYKNEIYPEWITIDKKNYGIPAENIDLEIGIFEVEEGKIIYNSEEAIELPGITEGVNVVPYVFAGPDIVNGTISFTSIDLIENDSYNYMKNRLFDEQFRIFSEDKSAINKLNEIGYVSYIATDSYTGVKDLVAIKKIVDSYGETLYLFSIMSLESVGETTDIMQSYFLITVAVAIFLAIIFSYIYSRKLAKPLLHLNEVTAKLANIDFTTKCVVETSDEIEDLANNINIMSERLENTLKQLKQFLADASHELKTPLTVMKGIVEGLIDGVYDVKNPEHYKRIQSEINDMSQLVYDLLELSKLESGELNFNEDIFQLSDVILKTHDKLTLLAKEKKITVSLSLEEYFVRGNEAYIEKVIRNFYLNAIQYTENGGKIAIKMIEDGEISRFEIENSPSHILEESIEKLWQPFFRVEQSRNKELGGTGLGLYMIKEIMEKHKMDYGIENSDQGVIAYAEFPIEKNIE